MEQAGGRYGSFQGPPAVWCKPRLSDRSSTGEGMYPDWMDPEQQSRDDGIVNKPQNQRRSGDSHRTFGRSTGQGHGQTGQ
jgi:hypothetical protein